MKAPALQYLPLDEVIPDERNPKGHDTEGIAASIDRFGYAEPITVDDRTGKLVSGHGRLQSLKDARDAGTKPPKGIRKTKGQWLVPVNFWTSRNDEEALAFIIAANATTERGGWEDEGLLGILTRLEEASTLAGSGFDTGDMDDLRARLEEVAERDQEGAEFRARQIRSIILEFSIEDFDYVTEAAARARAQYGIPSNAELFEYMLEHR